MRMGRRGARAMGCALVTTMGDDERKLLVLDLDETLVYADLQPLDREADFRIFEYHVYRRPYLDRFLRFCGARFRVAVWTSSSGDYAAEIVDRVFPEPEALEFVWSRARCSIRFDPEEREQYWQKRLKKLRRLGYALEQVIAVDDTPRKHEQNYGNLVRVREFLGDPADDELLRLEAYLLWLEHVPNVRAVEKRGWQWKIETDDLEVE